MSQQKTIISYQNTYGVESWGAGRFINHPGVATVVNGCAAAGGLVLGWPVAVLGIAVAFNDILAAKGDATVGPVRDVFTFDSTVAPKLSGSTSLKDASTDEDDEWEYVEIDADGTETIIDSPSSNAVDVPAKTIVTPPPIDPAEQTTTTRKRPDEVKLSDNPWAGVATTSQSQAPTPQETQNYQISPEHQQVLDNAEPMELPLRIAMKGIANELLVEEDGFLRSWMIFSPTGGGKGTLIAFAILLFKQQHPDAAIYAIDPKADPKEFKRWAMIPVENRVHYNASLPDLGGDRTKRVQESIRLLLDKYENDPAEIKLLISDEQPTNVQVMGKFGREMKQYFHRKAGMGRSRGHIVWATSNQMGLRENGMTSGERDNYQLMYLASARKLRPIKDCRSFPGQRIEESDEVFDATGRAAWCSTTAEWCAVPKSYCDAVEGLPDVVPPAGFGDGGTSKDLSSIIAVRDLAEQLTENLEDMGARKAKLIELVEGTDLEGSDPDGWSSLLPALKTRSEILVTQRGGNIWIALPKEQQTDDKFGGNLFFE